MSPTVGEATGAVRAFLSVLRALHDRLAALPSCRGCGKPYRKVSNWSQCRSCRSARLAQKYADAAAIQERAPNLEAQKAARLSVTRHANIKLLTEE